jgi:HTH-type transcriptional regulator/antitoxin HipB
MVIKSPTDIGAVIKEQRIKLGLDQDALAKKAGTSRKWLIEVEKGKPGAELELVLRTLRTLGITLHTTERSSRRSEARAGSSPSVDLDAVLNSLKRKP